MASRGLSVEARFAGKIPVRYPTPAEKTAIKARKFRGNENKFTDCPPN